MSGPSYSLERRIEFQVGFQEMAETAFDLNKYRALRHHPGLKKEVMDVIEGGKPAPPFVLLLMCP
jgi:hypothetical protein